MRTLFILLLALGSCARHTPAPSPPQKESIRHLLHASEFARDSQRFAASRSNIELDVVSYDLKGSFDWEKKTLRAVLTVTLSLLDEVATKISLDAFVTTIQSVRLSNGEALNYEYDQVGLLNIDIGTAAIAMKGAPITLVIAYESKSDLLPTGAPHGITAVSPRLGDPLASRVVFTTSEPLGAPEWMPCHNTPADRAHFSVEFEMPASEQLISNGLLKSNAVSGGIRRMRYETAYTLPTYLMAFAVGEFVTATAYHGSLPVSIWARQGLNVDYTGLLAELMFQIKHFEKLIGSYPFEKYSLVLLPEFPSGGIEHASITFQAENRSSQSMLSGDRSLTAHELAHQWFGDLVTIKTWNDLWIKEGMATLLAEEASRRDEDKGTGGRLFGRNFEIKDGEAILDESLAPDDKYTSGPYDRAAWWLTQVRHQLGEQNFWVMLRQVLKDYAFRAISTEEFLTYLSPLVDAPFLNKARLALKSKALPLLSIQKPHDALEFSIKESEPSLLVPVEIRIYFPEGHYKTYTSSPNGFFGFTLPREGLVLFDPSDVHPVGEFKGAKEAIQLHLADSMVPSTFSESVLFSKLNPAEQLQSLDFPDRWTMDPLDVKHFWGMLRSEEAKFLGLSLLCNLAQKAEEGVSQNSWERVIEPLVLQQVYRGLPNIPEAELASCASVMSEVALSQILNRIETAPHLVSEADLHFFSFLFPSPEKAFRIWRGAYQGASTVRTRVISVNALLKFLSEEELRGAPVSEWKDWFTSLLDPKLPTEIVRRALRGVLELDCVNALPKLSTLINESIRPRVQGEAICTAYGITQKHQIPWGDFSKTLRPTEFLKGYVSGPETYCGAWIRD